MAAKLKPAAIVAKPAAKNVSKPKTLPLPTARKPVAKAGRKPAR